jgi:hypothetical protein
MSKKTRKLSKRQAPGPVPRRSRLHPWNGDVEVEAEVRHYVELTVDGTKDPADLNQAECLKLSPSLRKAVKVSWKPTN